MFLKHGKRYPEVFVYTLLPIDFLSRFDFDLVDKSQIDDYINLQTSAAEREYDQFDLDFIFRVMDILESRYI